MAMRESAVLSLCILIAVTLQNSVKAEDGPVLQTNSGALKGLQMKARGKDTVIHSYLGIPFAKPPVGPLRLAPPQPAEKWDGVRDATKQPLMCLQDRPLLEDLVANLSAKVDMVDSAEDCLYLNVYTPSKPGGNDKLPVMVWIHGGGFMMASASLFDGHVLAAYQDVVVVVIQYRLGLLGFFSTGDEHAPGNYGLLDQVAALQWVQENIHSFGGDPGSVTIFGESAGGISVSLHVLSPLSANLFHRAIAESGTAAMEAIMNLNPLPIAQAIGNASGCDISSTKKIVDCLMQKSEVDILKITKENPLFRFGVTTDGQFLPRPAAELLQSQQFNKVPLMTGVTDDEIGFLLPAHILPPDWIDGLDLETILPLLTVFSPALQDQSVLELLLNEYLGTSPDRIKIRDGFREMLGDFMFNFPARQTASYHRDAGAPVYLYEFCHPPSVLQKKRPSFSGSDHGDEIVFVFGYCFSEGPIGMAEKLSDEEDELCRTIMAYWGNFAHTGNPNGPGLTSWPEFGDEAEYLSIGLDQKASTDLKGKHFTFMTQTLPRIISERKEGPVVNTKLGSLKGSFMTAKGKDSVISSYFAIPFAKPPVGPLRLTPPQPADAWQGVRDATKQPPMCLQPREIIVDLLAATPMKTEFPEVSEDCLYLNIYTPSKPGDGQKLPVMVWIHGGGLAFGSASMFDGHALAAYQDVVVVMVQYRLGLLGFFSTGDEHAPGNYGLLDQVAALQWVQENIHSFGGDPGSVTIFGESAGGVSVSLLVLSPLSANLFHRAIAESGTAAMNALMSPYPLSTAQSLGNVSGCDISSTKKIVDCVMQMTEEDILKIAREQVLYRFGVTVDGQFLPKSVDELLQSLEFSKVPLMTGVTDDDGGFTLPDIMAPPGWRDGMTKEQIVPFLPSYNYDLQDQGLAEIVLKEYLGATTDKIEIRDGFREIIGDFFFNLPARKIANHHRDTGAPVYMYEFQHPAYIFQNKRPSFVGCDHTDELVFVFGYCFGNGHIKLEGELSKEEHELCKTTMAYWGNFARTGNPNGPGLVEWPKYGAEAEYLGIGLEQKSSKNFKGNHFHFMTEKLPQIIKEWKEGPVVNTKLGSLRGSYMMAKGKDSVISSYLAIPFAKPPVGPLRLTPPQPAGAWQGVRDATKQPPMCLQTREVMVDLLATMPLKMEFPEVSEDCLYLNIYTPTKPGDGQKLPVMVWIHGGGLAFGSASMFDGHALAAYQDVVVVMVQYRLGLLGFFSTGDEHAPGNYGLLDQVAALQWVQENIHSFGGDPGSVTIFGESAGGVSASLLVLSPLSANLFHRAIAESGTAAMNAIMSPYPLPTAQSLGNVSGCDISSTKKIVDCVMQMTEEDILKIAREQLFLLFGVTVDGQFLPKSVDELLQSQEFSKVPLMTGVTDDDGGFTLPDIMAPPGWRDGMTKDQIVPFLPSYNYDLQDQGLAEIVLKEYLGATTDKIKIRDGFREIIGDFFFNLPARKLANYHRDTGAPVYMYEFQHPAYIFQNKRPSFVGCDHGDELLFVFGYCFGNGHMKVEGELSKEEHELCKTTMAYWGNFARTGNPNGPGLVEWPKYGAEAEYLGIGLEQKFSKNFKGNHFHFMTEKLPQIIKEWKEGPVVNTKLGSLRGSYVMAKGKDSVISSYFAVPFAKPPVGPLRLTPPQPAVAWQGVRDATKQPPMCLQPREKVLELLNNISMSTDVPEVSEDCLYLNIYTPSKSGDNKKLPVMVWIHGGGLILGSASIYDGHALAAYQDVVVVEIQYRLGLLGFFSTGDEHAPGNYGLLDQVAALQWVQENIHSFGGDPGSVTIFGESAGGVSSSLHVLSPLSANLFHRAIAESGTAAIFGELIPDPLPIAQLLGNTSGCDISSPKKIVDCVMQMTEEDILKIAREAPNLHGGVTVDGQFLPKPVNELLKSKEFNKVPLMIGVTDDDGGFTLANMHAPPGWIDGMDREQVTAFMPFAIFNSEFQDEAIAEFVLNEYLGTSTDRIQIRDTFREMMTDLFFNIPARKLANYHRDTGAPVYLYEFQHRPSIYQNKRPSFVGCDHGDELLFVFGDCFANGHIKVEGEFSEEENELCRTTMTYWGNFARTGSPNGPGLTKWPEFGAEAEYLAIGLEQKASKNFKGNHFHYVTQELPQIIKEWKEGPVVETKLGSLRGAFLTVKGKDTIVNSYLGVPFAKPPVGRLRLARPQPAEKWQGVRDATKQPRMCLQERQMTVTELKFLSMDVEVPEVSEDCLYLNIYTPVKPGQEDKKLPVMVWIHGGGLSLGSASVYDGSVLAAYQDVVVVLIQYRLGLLGFLSTGDEHAPGNYGLLDQVAALQWVQENIHSFGGDPGSVTIFGESAGGISVSTLILSPLASGLFHRAIAESGTVFWDGLVMADPFQRAQAAAKQCDCDSSSSARIVDCIMHWSEEEALECSMKFQMMHFSIAVDSYFLPKPIEEIVEQQQFSKVPLINGINNDEFGFLLAEYFLGPEWINGLKREQIAEALTLTYPDPKDRWIIDLVAKEYLGDTQDPIEIRDVYREMMGDVLFNIPALQLAKYHSGTGAPVYLYELQHPPSIIQKKRPSFVGVDHADDLYFIQGTCFAKAHLRISAPFTEEENELCRTMMAYWGNFAHTGSPNGPGLTHWPEYENENEYLAIGLQQRPGKNLKHKHFEFMTKTLPELIRQGKGKTKHSEL
ncbi:uncharacterized protein ces2b isoform X2 [Danio aesculapii]|uniref:uncharacterized protein ces2b isoform X2 n=1 Tax=Danio aesculapii TaxID=1142201 RepID=UPI0024C058BA|nr:uncharacterized protein ces2b isoform X2 [Danio aesculapii]